MWPCHIDRRIKMLGVQLHRPGNHHGGRVRTAANESSYRPRKTPIMPTNATLTTESCSSTHVSVSLTIDPCADAPQGVQYSRTYEWTEGDGYVCDKDDIEGSEASGWLDVQATYGDRGINQRVTIMPL
jgi:hypothetical protein